MGSLDKIITMTTASVSQEVFGATCTGEEVSRFTLTNGNVELSVISWGATITSVKVGGVDVVLGFDSMAGYTSSPPCGKNPYMGAVVGRVANRIADGKFKLDGKEYQLAKNNGPNSLHGGLVGLDKVLWGSTVDQEAGTVTFSYFSKGAVKINFTAMVSAPTPINLANHVYFNLAGHQTGAKGLNDHVMRMSANCFTPVSD